jgi:hypothetical protein
MITITIGKKKYKGVYKWEDVTLQRFYDLASIPMPEGYESYIIADGKFTTENIEDYVKAVKDITEEQINILFPEYFRKVVEVLTDIPGSVIRELPQDKVNDLYEYYFKPFVVSIIYHTPVIHFMGQIKQYEPPQVKDIKIGFNRFYTPEAVIIEDRIIPLAKEPIVSYSDASDIYRDMKMTKESIKRLALFMAIYCRKKGEKYSDEKAVQRQWLFMRVPMSTVWAVFFYTVRRLPSSLKVIQLFGSLPRPVQEVREAVYQSSAVVD